jgi:hypothetical protein
MACCAQQRVQVWTGMALAQRGRPGWRPEHDGVGRVRAEALDAPGDAGAVLGLEPLVEGGGHQSSPQQVHPGVTQYPRSCGS